jgi:L-asparaginase II
MQVASTQKPETNMTPVNPIIAEILRGTMVESRHRGAFAVCDASGKIVQSMGNSAAPVYPRSAIKAFQALPMLQSGAADRFGLTPEEIALCCSSHDGEPEHVRVARSILAKAGNSEHDLECGSHWPSSNDAMRAMVRAGEVALPIHNNCSGKHAGMLALARQLDVDVRGYVKPDHPIQKQIAKAYGAICGLDLSKAPMAIDGCSVPTWALPLSNVATGFAQWQKDSALLQPSARTRSWSQAQRATIQRSCKPCRDCLSNWVRKVFFAVAYPTQAWVSP